MDWITTVWAGTPVLASASTWERAVTFSMPSKTWANTVWPVPAVE